MISEVVTIPVTEPEKVSGTLSMPDSGADTGILLAHGAGNDMNHPMLSFLGDGLAKNGYLTLRFNFLGYPLHAPGRKDRVLDGHLYEIPIPMLFFAGTRDQLCDLQLLRQVLSKVIVPWELEVIDGGDHSFHAPKSYATDPTQIYEQIVSRTVQ
jgi:predicted alpha/beta-hydrolase family hydrolase